jgi:hypothetical protein
MKQAYSEIPVTSSREFGPEGALDCSEVLELAIAVLSSPAWEGSSASLSRLRCLLVLCLGILSTVSACETESLGTAAV